jgi:hypothetical protein
VVPLCSSPLGQARSLALRATRHGPVTAAFRAEALTNVSLRYASADFARPETVPASEIHLGIPTEPPDLIAIDSLDHFTHRARPVLFRRAEELVRRGGLVLVDDA